MSAWAYLTAVVLLAICGSCSGPTSFRVVDDRTGQPLSGIAAMHTRAGDDVANFFLGRPPGPGTTIVAKSETGADGRVAFRGVDAGHWVTFSIGSGEAVTAFPCDDGTWVLSYSY